MAYRSLEVGDYVKVVKKGCQNFGKFGTVDFVDTEYPRVVLVVHSGRNSFDEYDVEEYCFNDLLLAVKPKDYVMVFGREELGDIDVTLSHPGEYDGWDREDLIERIKELELELEKHNVWK